MSILDLILEQSLILIMIGVAVVLLLGAAVLAVVIRARTLEKKHLAAKRKHKILNKEQVADLFEVDDTPGMPQGIAPATGMRPGSPPLEPLNVVGSDVAQKTEEESEEDKEIQNLLFDVFGGEDEENDFAVLLEGVDAVSTTDLQSLASQLMHQLSSGRSSW